MQWYAALLLYHIGSIQTLRLSLTSTLLRCDSQVKLAKILGRPDSVGAALQKRGDDMAALIRDNLWDESLGIFVNKFSANATFYERITPTSFYALQAHAATDAQADQMVRQGYAVLCF